MKKQHENQVLREETTKRNRRSVLLLNASEEVLRVVSWQRAATLLISGKARSPYNFDHAYEISLYGGRTTNIPSAMVLTEYVRIPYIPMRPTRNNIFRRDGLTCQYTGQKLRYSDASIDHILPTSRGGKHAWNNVVTCAKWVNSKKGSRTPEEAGLTLIRKPVTPDRKMVVVNTCNPEQLDAWSRWLV